MIGIGTVYYLKRPESLDEERRKDATHSDFTSAFFLNLANPTIVLSFLAFLAVLGIQDHKAWWLTALAIAGIDGAVLWMNRIAGFAIGGFGPVTLILSCGGPK